MGQGALPVGGTSVLCETVPEQAPECMGWRRAGHGTMPHDPAPQCHSSVVCRGGCPAPEAKEGRGSGVGYNTVRIYEQYKEDEWGLSELPRRHHSSSAKTGGNR